MYATCFWLFAALTLGSAGVVAFSRNIVRSAYALLLTFWGVAGLYAMAGADFLAVAQVVIYVGGILVLILFAVMLTHKISEFKLANESSFSLMSLLAFAGVLILTCWTVAVAVPWPTSGRSEWVPTTDLLGKALLNEYLLPFEVVSVLLLGALVGAAYLARKEVKSPPAQTPSATS